MSPNPSFRTCRCGQLSLDDSDWCAACETIEKRRIADAVKALRDKRSKAGRCVDCGRAACQQDIADKRKHKLCTKHRIKRERFRARGVTRVVTRTRDRAVADFRVSEFPGEEGRTRFHGQGEKGKPSTSALNLAAAKLVQRNVNDAVLALELAEAPEMESAGRVQRKDARDAALDLFALAERESRAMRRRNHHIESCATCDAMDAARDRIDLADDD